ncbi:hypothetical protein [Streptomyces sp. H27-C3]|uniref:hypothetical protein n=1 Tax=Streptomyces sp. H27-C3 TaxID=3046305 RepID=UPI0024BBA0D7|nr:hypothetical protein [Streptomyces sp. H27-C3]MDJ0466452.1 hypothetical protein [Streptomyces sp. H27-C3]
MAKTLWDTDRRSVPVLLVYQLVAGACATVVLLATAEAARWTAVILRVLAEGFSHLPLIWPNPVRGGVA